MDFATHLQTLRKRAGLSQESLADQLHISRQAVSKWEMGQSAPDIETCLALCQVLNITPNQLLLGEEEEQRDKKERHFAVAAIFIALVCACGVSIVTCGTFRPDEFLMPSFLYWHFFMYAVKGSLLTFAGMLAYHLWRHHSAKGQ